MLSIGDGDVLPVHWQWGGRQLCRLAWYRVAASVGTRVQTRTDVLWVPKWEIQPEMKARASLCGDVSDVGDGCGFRPSRESINAGEEIGTSFRRWKWSNKVSVDVVKASIRACEGRQWSNCVTMNAVNVLQV